ncbi:RICIN domain-containing protein [Nonomuraea sp. PA05]|uniref:RICIN domain-containing protein n=1 Tax=Nonomuraea sp. PA05 TaxID=2604466 RepID=UPI001651F708|nr:ricin-type beta-trefoil lectin domain protein [Nonomuraea sp. PA05]
MHRSIRRVVPVSILAVAALFTAQFLATPAHADFRWSEPISNQKDEGFCIGIGGGSSDAGARTGLYRCDGRVNQDYQFLDNRFNTRIKVNNGGGHCLVVDSVLNAEGSRDVFQGSCTVSGDRARWQLASSAGGVVHPTARLASIRSLAYPGFCIGAGGGAMFHDNVVKAYHCDFKDYGNQNWVVNRSQSTMP